MATTLLHLSLLSCLLLFHSSHIPRCSARTAPSSITAKEAFIQYWNLKFPNKPLPSFFTTKLSPLSPLELIPGTVTDGDASNSKAYSYHATAANGDASNSKAYSYHAADSDASHSKAYSYHATDGDASNSKAYSYHAINGDASNSKAYSYHATAADGDASNSKAYSYHATAADGDASNSKAYSYHVTAADNSKAYSYHAADADGDASNTKAYSYHATAADADGDASKPKAYSYHATDGDASNSKAYSYIRMVGDNNSKEKTEKKSADSVKRLNLFFRESNLTKGTVMPMGNIRVKMAPRPFLPRSVASMLPLFSAEEVKKLFHIPADSTMGKAIDKTISHCKSEPSKGESKVCLGSAEDMIDFVVSKLGPDAVVRNTESGNGSKGNILVGDVKVVNGGKLTESVSCHQTVFPYMMYFCHSVPKVRMYEADILDVETKEKINHGTALCHSDTSDWSPGHVAFVELGSTPGQIEVCHWVFEGDMAAVAE